jgi:hypothetical protein
MNVSKAMMLQVGAELIDNTGQTCTLISKDEYLREAKKEWVMLHKNISSMIDNAPEFLLVRYHKGRDGSNVKYWRVIYTNLTVVQEH